MDSIGGYLDNISNVLVKTIDQHYQNNNTNSVVAKIDSAGSEQEDETSIQETITIKDRKNG